VSAVLDRIPGQDAAISFLKQAVPRPHHAYVFAGPEGSGKSLAARAFAASLLCAQGGCGECRACRLALADRHPNVFIVEPEGRDIHVEAVRDDVWHNVYRTSPEPGRKVFLVREADRLNAGASDVLLKVLEEPPGDTVLILSSARPHEMAETLMSRCHTVTFTPLEEGFVVQSLVDEGFPREGALLATRLTGGNLGRARRLVRESDGLAFRDAAAEALGHAVQGHNGAFDAAEVVLKAAKDYKKTLKAELERDLATFMGDDGRPDDSYRGVIKRVEDRHKRRERRAERDYVDWVLLAISAMLRDDVMLALGGDRDWRINLDLEREPHVSAVRAARVLGAVEEARAALADETNLNTKLVLEQAFLEVARTLSAA
jgi:DNA polymerase-3 subunit delta'